MTFQAAQSRAIRNVVLAGVPRWLTDQAKERAKDAVLKGINQEGLAVATEKALKFLAGYGISEARVSAVLGKPKQAWISEDIASLRGLASQLKDGQATAAQLFPPLEDRKECSKGKSRGKRGCAAKVAESGNPSPSASLMPQPTTLERLEAIMEITLEKGIDLELILQQWQVSRLEDLDDRQVHQVQEWLKSQ